MTKATNTALSHPLVAAYLADLDRALSSADAQERLDTVTAVTEHLTDALGGDSEPTTEHVRAVLDELGSVDRIAEAATPASASDWPTSAAVTEDRPQGYWVAPALLAASIVALVLPVIGILPAIACLVVAIVMLRGENPRRGMLRATIGVSIVTLVFNAALIAGPLYFTGTGPVSVTGSAVPEVGSSTSP